MRWPALLLVLGGCLEGGGSNQIAPRCGGTCEFALGADTYLVGMRTEMNGDHLQAVDRIDVSSDGVVDLSRLDANTYLAHAAAAGTVELTAVVDGDTRTEMIEVSPAVIGPIVVDGLPASLVTRPDRFAVFQGSASPMVSTELQTAGGAPLIGHGLETWTPVDRVREPIVGVDLAGAPELDWSLFPDHPLVRVVSVDAQPVTVSNGADMVTFTEVPAHSTDHFDVVSTHASDVVPTQPFTVGAGAGVIALTVVPWTSDATLLIGEAVKLSASSDSPSVTVTVDPDGRGFGIYGVSSGSGTVTIAFDGITEAFSVHVP